MGSPRVGVMENGGRRAEGRGRGSNVYKISVIGFCLFSFPFFFFLFLFFFLLWKDVEYTVDESGGGGRVDSLWLRVIRVGSRNYT